MRRMVERWLGVVSGLLVLALTACGPSPTATSPATVSSLSEPGPVRRFAYPTIDGGVIRSSHLRGRMTLVVHVTTYDTASQAQARIVQGVLRKHAPRINALLVALEPPRHKMLVEAFVQSLGLTYPAGLADADTIAGRGPFEGLQHVPSLVLLDRQGRERWRRLGLVAESELRRVLERYDDGEFRPMPSSTR